MLCYRAVDTTADEEGGGRDGMKLKVTGVAEYIIKMLSAK